MDKIKDRIAALRRLMKGRHLGQRPALRRIRTGKMAGT